MTNPIETLTPNATVIDDNWTPTGSATLHGATSDASDSTYARPASSGAEYMHLGLSTSTLALASGSQVRSVTARMRISTATPSSTKAIHIAQMYGTKSTDYTTFYPTATVTTVTASSWAKAPDGGAWTQTKLDNFFLRFRSDGSTGNTVYEAYADIEYNTAPTTTVTTPSGAQATATPTVTWTYVDSEDDLQERYRVKIFSAAQYGIGGFDPDTSPNTWDSGEVFSSATTTDVAIGLVNGTSYRAYVKTADTGSSGRYSAWAYSAFSISLTPPPTPTVVATADNTLARTSLLVTEGGASPVTTYFEVERSEDGGTTWEQIRDGDVVTNTGGVAGNTVYDYEAHRGIAVQYRTRAVLVSGSDLLISPWSSTSSSTLTHTNSWLKSANNPSLNIKVFLNTHRWEITRKQAKKIAEALNKKNYTARRGMRHGYTGPLRLYFENNDAWLAFDALVDSDDVILFQTPYGETSDPALQFWMELGEEISETRVTQPDMATSQKIYIETVFGETDAP